MRPTSIIWFERLFLLSLAIALANAVLSYEAAVAMVQADPVMGELGWGDGFVIAVIAISLAIPLILALLIARRASSLAKWVLVGLVALGLLFISFDTETILSLANVGTAATTILQIAAVALLFRKDAVEWLGGAKAGQGAG